ncbi:hypothetical protein BP6252_06381 [Coleophoma cylindrospora]|uniref:Late endosomal/lysosomal adaptor and MAPK and MTOR activator-domain-containing protein n=1 Tax=Coleophoma cylindrospora TaxID=1849047 RepID=A0A3D8RMG1_9HELO|nr:hypothetical protein BP6252_06381 [Coleophoma cylindrospora]
MGVCASCLGLNKTRDESDEDEQSRLLFDDAHASQYGSFGEHNTGLVQADPQEVQRETEALQKVVAQTSKYTPSHCSARVAADLIYNDNAPRMSTTSFAGQDTRILRYQDILAKVTANTQKEALPQFQSTSNTTATDGWISDEDDLEEAKTFSPVKSADLGPLVGGFADAESAME